MKLAHHIIFIFCVLTYFPGFVYSHGGKQSNEILLDYVKNSGGASKTCRRFRISKGTIHAGCKKIHECTSYGGLFPNSCSNRKKASISLHTVAKAIKNKKKNF